MSLCPGIRLALACITRYGEDLSQFGRISVSRIPSGSDPWRPFASRARRAAQGPPSSGGVARTASSTATRILRISSGEAKGQPHDPGSSEDLLLLSLVLDVAVVGQLDEPQREPRIPLDRPLGHLLPDRIPRPAARESL